MWSAGSMVTVQYCTKLSHGGWKHFARVRTVLSIINIQDGHHPRLVGSSHKVAAGSGEVLGNVLVVCGSFDDFVVWQIIKDIIGMQKVASCWVPHHTEVQKCHTLKCRSDTHL